MIPEIVPVITTDVDWAILLASCQTAMGRSLTTQLDNHRMRPDSIKAFIAAIGAFRLPDSSPSQILQNPGSLLNHAFYGFLIACDVDVHIELLEDSGLNVLSTDTQDRTIKLCLATGLLSQWRTAIINGCSAQSGKGLRLLLDKCLIHFESLGLGNIWSDYSKKTLKDSTFALVLK